MSTDTLDAIFEHGSFHLIRPPHIPLRDGQRVRLVVDTDEVARRDSSPCGQRLRRVVSARRDGGGTHCTRPAGFLRQPGMNGPISAVLLDTDILSTLMRQHSAAWFTQSLPGNRAIAD